MYSVLLLHLAVVNENAKIAAQIQSNDDAVVRRRTPDSSNRASAPLTVSNLSTPLRVLFGMPMHAPSSNSGDGLYI
jgi:hypothetical protein